MSGGGEARVPPGHRDLLAEALGELRRMRARIEQLEGAAHQPVAVIGLACRLPGGADGPDALWRLLREGRDAVGEAPPERWADPAGLSPAERRMSRRGAFLPAVDQFSPGLFGISPREAAVMDPQQRLLLEVAWEALEHAGQAPDGLAGTATGVFVGLCGSDWSRLLWESGWIDPYVVTGAAASVAAGRLSYVLGLQGPSVSIDTACSSSLVAVHQACHSLRSGECDLALAGGVNLILTPHSTLAVAALGLLASDGRCKTFDAAADGYVRGEGCGVVVLKRLADAQAAGDRVLAVIRGSAVNHDGRSSGLTVPNGPAQQAVLRRALAVAGVAPADVAYLEAHGTGTALGDPVEMGALRAVLGQGRGAGRPLVVGSIKTNLGHLEGAAGIAGLIKVVLALQHGEIPPHLHFQALNPHIPAAGPPILVPAAALPWPEGRRLAGVSSFGASGTNAHVVVEAAPAAAPPAAAAAERPLHVLCLSAATPEALSLLADRYGERLADGRLALADAAFTANTGRAHLEQRLAVCAATPEAAAAALAAFAAGAPGGLPRGRRRPGGSPKVAFLFSGQGVQHPGMGSRLYATQATFRGAIDRCGAILGKRLPVPLPTLLDPRGGELLADVALGQVALFAAGYALAETWRQWGVQPAAVAGHSLGEYTAACVAGVLALEDALDLVAERGRLMRLLPGDGGMAAVYAAAGTVADILAELPGEVTVAAVNGPREVTVAGRLAELDAACQALAAHGIESRRLAVRGAFHSPWVEPMLDAFEAHAARVRHRPAAVRLASSLTGAWAAGEDMGAAYWRRHTRQPVRFAAGLERLLEHGCDVFIELGPRPALLASARRARLGPDALWLPSLRAGRDDWATLLDSLARLHAAGGDVDWAAFDKPYPRRRVALPTYPFERQRCWIPAPAGEIVPAEWLYQIAWPAAELPPAGGRPAPLTPLAGAAEALGEHERRLAARHGLDAYARRSAALDGLCAAYAVQALDDLGWTPAIDAAGLADTLGVAPRHRRLLARLLAMAAEDGLAAAGGGPAVGDPAALAGRLRRDWPQGAAQLALLERCGSGLAAVLRGDTDPLELLFPAGGDGAAQAWYHDSPFARVSGGVVREALAQATAGLAAGERLAILEIGAGTGGTSAAILADPPWPPGVEVEYWFTDLSPGFLTQAAARFAGQPFVRYRRLDIEQDPAPQGFPPHGFDLVLAANVLHATADLRRTLDHAGRLLAPGGWLLLVEGTVRQRWLDLVFGLLDGWWKFADPPLRADSPLLTAGGWLALLERAGFAGALAVPRGQGCGQSVLVARAPSAPMPPAQPPADAPAWLILADAGGVGEALAEAVRRQGARVLIGAAAGRDDLRRLLAAAAALRPAPRSWQVVQLSGLDAPAVDAAGGVEPDAALATACGGALAAVQELARGPLAPARGAAARLWLVTRGAQPAAAGDVPDAAQAAVWGLGRVAAREHAALWGGLIDLAPEERPAAAAACIAAQVASGDGEDQVAFRAGRRHAARLVRRDLPLPAPRPPLAAGGACLITGGLGGAGLLLAHWLAGQGVRQLILVGRRGRAGASPAGEAALAAIEALGARVHTAAADVADEPGLAALLAGWRAAGGAPIRGVVHAAGLDTGGPVGDLPPAELAAVLRPKVRGAWLLARLLRDEPLAFFVLFSSVGAFMGVPGQASYAAANAALDALACGLRARGMPALSLGWGAWEGTGMAARLSWSERLRDLGAGAIAPRQALAVFGRAVAGAAPHLAVLPMDWQRYGERLGAGAPRLFAAWLGAAGGNRRRDAPQPQAAPPAPGDRPQLQRYLADLVAQVIGGSSDSLDADRSFGTLGIDSLMAVQLKNRIEADLGAVLPMTSFLQGASVGRLADRLLEQLAGGAPAPPQATDATGGEPLSAAQQSLWLLDRLAPGTNAYNIPAALQLDGSLDRAALRRALDEIVRRHAVLRATFAERDGQPVQKAGDAAGLRLPTVDLAALPPAAGQALAGRLATALNGRPFDLARGPLLRAWLLRLAARRHVLLLVVHHIAADGGSMAIFAGELAALYAAGAAGLPSPLPALPCQYADHSRRERQRHAAAGFADQLDHWRRRLAGELPVLALPSDRPRPAVQRFRGATRRLTLHAAGEAALRAWSREHEATLFMTLLAGFAALLYRATGQRDLLLGIPVTLRQSADTERLIGLFVNTLVLRLAPAGGLGFAGFAAQVREVALDAFAHADVPVERLAAELQPVRDPSRPPLFQTMFALHPDPLPRRQLPGLAMSRLDVEPGTAKLDFTLTVWELEAGLTAALEFNTDLFDGATMIRLLAHYEALLGAALDAPATALDALPLLSAAERHQVVRAWNDTAPPAARGDDAAPLAARVAALAAARPDAVAVVAGDRRLSWGELDRRADRLAHTLRRRGVRAEQIVALCVPRSLEMVVGLLGILKAGGAYLPLAPEHPPARLAQLAAAGGAVQLLTVAALCSHLAAAAAAPLLLDDAAATAGQPRGAPPLTAGAGWLAYLTYTSGSTGEPKGVLVEQRGVARLAASMRDHLGCGPDDVHLQLAPLAFDASTLEIWTPLLTGGCLVMAPPGRWSPAELGREVRRHGVTTLHLTTGLFHRMVEDGLADLRGLRRLLAGGDALSPRAVDRALDELPGVRLALCYGPTENTTFTSWHTAPRRGELPRSVPLGRPIQDTRAFVVDAALAPLPIGVAGELVTAGTGLARGYAGLAEATAERFVPDPLSGEPGGRLYRTGDLARWLPDGRLEFLGRADRQVKVRGFRIEPGEVEAALRRHPAVHDAVVAARPDGAGDRRLIAWLLPAAGAATGRGLELWPSIGEHPVYDDLIYYGLSHDEPRLRMYRQALAGRVAGRTVLDVGTGGDALLARLCAEAGAAQVYAVEVLPESCRKARQRVLEAGLADRVTVIQGDASTVELPAAVDLCVSEIFEAIGGAEGAAAILEGARRWLRPGGGFLPERSVTRIAAARLPDAVRDDPRFTAVAAHYVEAIFAAAGAPFDLRLCVKGFPPEALSSTEAVFEDLDFAAPVAAEFDREIELELLRDGRVDGFVLWLELHAGGQVLDVLRQPTAWFPAWFPVFEPGVELAAGDRIRARCSARLAAGRQQPDYRLEGEVTARGGRRIPFRHDSPHSGGAFRGTPFYRRLFRDGRVPVAARDDAAARDAELRAHLGRQLPEPLIPADLVWLDVWPLTSQGKLDRAALPAPDAARGGARPDAGGAPRTATEEVIAGIWAAVLGVERAGVRANFFALGGHSLLATQVLSRVRDLLGVEVPLRQLFDAPTVEALAARVDAARRRGLGAELPPVEPRRGAGGERRLSFAQERFWFTERLEAPGAAYLLAAALELSGTMHTAALAAAIDHLVRRHAALRTRFVERPQGPVQQAVPPAATPLPVVDLQGLPAARRRDLARRLMRQQGRRRFDLTAAPLVRPLLLRLDGGSHLLLMVLHHIACDGWSMRILVDELGELYGAMAAGRRSPLPPLVLEYADFADWQREQLTGERLAALLAPARERLAGIPDLDLPVDRPHPAEQSYRGARRALALPAALAADLEALAARQGATPFMVTLAALQALLGRYSGQQRLAVGSPIANRNRAEIEPLVGCFVNTLVLPADLAGDPGFGELLAQVRQTALAAYAQQDLPFELLVDAMGVRRSLSRPPLFQVLFVLQNATGGPVRIPGLDARRVEVDSGTAKFELSLQLERDAGAWQMTVEFATDLFDGATAGRLMGHYLCLLAEAVREPRRRLSELRLLSAAERHCLCEWNDTAPPSGAAPLLHQLVAAAAARHPEALALAGPGGSWSFGALEEAAHSLAWRLRQAGVGPEVPVGIVAQRTPQTLIGVLAVLAAGGVCVPLDPAWPAARLAWIVADADLRLLLGGPGLAPRWRSCGVPWIAAGGRPAPPAGGQPPASAPGRPPLAADHPVYLIYTSGSTGTPKGVVLPHRALANLVAWQLRQAGWEAAAVTLQLTPLSFDVAFQEIFSTWGAGGALVVAGEDERRDPEALLRLLAGGGIERLFVPFVALEQLAAAGAAGGPVPAALRDVVTAGEQLRVTPAVRQWFDRLGDCRLHNQYGPSESHVVTAWTLPGDPAAWEDLPPIGRPIAGARAQVLDAALAPLPCGVPGELHLSGDALARGYLGRPELTAQAFVPDPLANRPGERQYRTGDLVRRRPDGSLEFLGRIDHQVKVRGHRVEVGEIEAVLARHPQVQQAAVVGRRDAAGDMRLAAYVVPRAGGAAPQAAELRAFLADRLPAPLVPALYATLARLPLTATGKVHRAALPDPAPGAAHGGGTAGAGTAPRTPLAQMVAAVWADVLGVDRVGAGDDFFALGGHSLAATRMVARLRDALGCEVPLRWVFNAPVLDQLAQRIAAARDAASPLPPWPPLGRRAAGAATPLSFAQQRLWFLEELAPGSPLYTLAAAVRLTGTLRPAALAAALGRIVDRHEVLRTTFELHADDPVQRIAAPGRAPHLPLIDLASLPAGRRGGEIERLARQAAGRGFDLAAGPLLRAALLREDAGRHVLLFAVHHIAADGWSTGILMRELAFLVPALERGAAADLPELPVQYADFAVWQRQALCGERLDELLRYWREHLAGVQPLALPADRARGTAPAARGRQRRVALPPQLGRAVAAVARRRGCTPFMVLLAAFQAVLGRVAGQHDVAVGSPVAGRRSAALEPLVGFFVNTLVMRLDLGGDPTFDQLLGRARQAALGAYDHQDLPFERLVEELNPERSLGPRPLVQVLFALQSAAGAPPEWPGVELQWLPVPAATAKFDCTLALEPLADGYAGWLEHDRELFDAATVERLMHRFERFLAAAAARPELHLAQVPVLSAGELHQLVHEWNDTAAPAGGPALVHQAFAATAARQPDAVALVDGERALSYGELARQAGRLAHRLRERGVGAETPVAVCLPRGFDMIASFLAVLTAGGAYVPLDPAWPPARLALVGAEARPAVWLTRATELSNLPAAAAAAALLLDGKRLRRPERPAAAPDGAVGGSGGDGGLAYIMFTSGSTGHPKGIRVTHRAVLRLMQAAPWVRLGPREVCLLLAPAFFDASTFEIWAPLATGGRLVLAADRPPAPAELERLLERYGVTLLWLTSGLLQVVAEEGAAGLGPVRQVLFGGDVVPAGAVRQVLAARPGRTATHAYGPTEGTVFTLCQPLADAGAAAEPLSMGRPLADTRVHLLDGDLRPVPLGSAGQLCIAGDGLARDYLGRPELTAERFRPDPLAPAAGGRLYLSGDRARQRADGRVDFLGRLDGQVKVRGFRIEPAEIEAALGAHPAVRAAAVVARGRAPQRWLAAFVVAPGADAAGLRAALAGRLPAALVPDEIVLLDQLPLGPTGKVDRRGLAEGTAVPAAERQAFAAPATPTERELAAVWQAVLGVERVGRHDNFFALGGHSLLAARAVARIRAGFGVDLPLGELFTQPDLASVAAWVEGERARFAAVTPAPPPAVVAVSRERFRARRSALLPGAEE